MEELKFYLYEPNSVPLKRLLPKEVSVGTIGYTSRGDCFMCDDDNGEYLHFTELHSSELVPNEVIESLNEDSLRLFWTLSAKSLKKALDGLETQYPSEGE